MYAIGAGLSGLNMRPFQPFLRFWQAVCSGVATHRDIPDVSTLLEILAGCGREARHKLGRRAVSTLLEILDMVTKCAYCGGNVTMFQPFLRFWMVVVTLRNPPSGQERFNPS